MNNSKEQVRQKYKEIRRNISLKEQKDNCIFTKVIEEKNICSSDTILLYYSTKEEVDTLLLIEYFLSIGKKVALPKVCFKEIKFYYIKDICDVEKGKYNIFEPISQEPVIDFSNSVCIVPGICFDLYHYRVGYGGGYYDRFLSIYNGYSIGLTYQECLLKKIEIDCYDKCVDKVITD